MKTRVIAHPPSMPLAAVIVRAAAIACLLVAVTPTLAATDGASPFERLRGALDFGTTLEDIHHMLDERDLDSLPTDRVIILDGVAVEITVIDPEPDSFLVQVDLASGRWLGLSEVRLYQAYVFFQGPDFAARFHSGRPPEPGDSMAPADEPPGRAPIGSNSRVIVLGMLVDLYEDAEGALSPILEGIDIRLID